MSKRRQPQPLHPACVIDGETDPRELAVHRIGGATVVLCRKCFRRLALAMRTNPPPVWIPPDELEVIGHALLAEADLLATLAQSRSLFGQMLINRVKRDAPDQAPDDEQ